MTTHDGLTKGWTRDEMAARAARPMMTSRWRAIWWR